MQRNDARPFESSLSGAAARSSSTSARGDTGDGRSSLPSFTQAKQVKNSDPDDDNDDLDAEGSSEEQTVLPLAPPRLESHTSGEMTESSASSAGGGGGGGGTASSASSSKHLSRSGSSFLSSYRSKKRQLSDNAVSDTGIFLSPASTSATSKISCLECRASKTRCSGGEPCQRCSRLGRECVYKEHRRGRFSDSKRVQHLERTVQTLMGQLRALQTSTSISTSAPTPASSNSSKSAGLGAPPSLFRNVSSTTSTSSISSDRLHRDGSSSISNVGGASTSSIGSSSRTGTSSPSIRLPITKLLSHPLHLLSRAGSDIQARRSDDATLNSIAFLTGLSEPLHDFFDPIDMDVIRLSKAEALFRLFFDRIEPNVMLFDPALHSFDYVRTRSSLLLSSICFIASLFDTGSAQLSLDLEAHIYHLILPEVITESYRSIEIAQAFLLLALYHPAADTMVVGRSYQFIGMAEQIALELNLNRAQQSRFADGASTTLAGDPETAAAQELEAARQVRNAERTWLGIWIGEMMLSERMGRAPLVRADSSVLSSASWHTHPLALSSDSTIVCIVQMHLIVSRQLELGERIVFVAQPNVVPTIETTIQMFWKSGLEQLDAWLSVWAGTSPANTNASSADGGDGGRRSSSSSDRINATEKMASTSSSSAAARPASHHQAVVVFSRAKLDYWYARVLFATRGLRLPFENEVSSLQGELYRDAFHSGMAYIQVFLKIVVPDGLTYGHDGVVIAPVYVMVVCLHILASMPDSVEQWNVDVQSVFSRVQELIDGLSVASNVSAHRRGVAGKLMPLLRAILNEVQESIERHKAGSKKRRSSSQQYTHVGNPSTMKKHDVPQSSSTNLAGLQTTSQTASTAASTLDWSRDDQQSFTQYLNAVAEQNRIPPSSLSDESTMQAMMSFKHPPENQQEMDYNMAMADPRAELRTQAQVPSHPSQQFTMQALWSEPRHRSLDANQTPFFGGQSGAAQSSASTSHSEQRVGTAADPALMSDPQLHNLLFGTPFNVQGQQNPQNPTSDPTSAQSPPREHAHPEAPSSSS